MAKFNTQPSYKQPGPKSPMTSTGTTKTYEGGDGFTRDAKAELFLLAVTNMVGEDTFYEAATNRDDRYATLVRQVTLDDPAWMFRFLGWLRNDANMRSASVVAAAEAVLARREAKVSTPFALPSIGEMGTTRSFIPQAMARADEPGEFVAYWAQRTGSKTLPGGVQRGVADAMVKLFDEYAYTKYGRPESGFQLADLVDLVHPGHTAPWQADLWQHALNERHGRGEAIPASLEMLAKRAEILAMPVEQRRRWLATDGAQAELRAAGITWEQLSGWLGGALDAKFWESVIPSMGYMALLRNLRNFEKADISRSVRKGVQERLADPEQVRRSRQFPYRFLSAYMNVQSDWWSEALSDALDASLANLPEFTGRTAVVVDTSGSMRRTITSKSKIRHLDIAGLMGAAMTRASSGDLYEFADLVARVEMPKGQSVLKAIAAMDARNGHVGHGTELVPALKHVVKQDDYDRIVIVTDFQAFAASPDWGGWHLDARMRRQPMSAKVTSIADAGTVMYGINPVGYTSTGLDLSQRNRYEIGGFSDQVFRMMAMIEAGNADWPF